MRTPAWMLKPRTSPVHGLCLEDDQCRVVQEFARGADRDPEAAPLTLLETERR